MVVWLVFGRGRAVTGVVVVGVGTFDVLSEAAVVFTITFRGLLVDDGGVDGGGVDAAEEEVDAFDDLGEL